MLADCVGSCWVNANSLAMEAARYHTLEQLFEDALQLPSEERHPFVERVRSDDEQLGDALQRLLVGLEQAPEYVAQLKAVFLASADCSDEVTRKGFRDTLAMFGRTVSHYRVLDEIGRGGMGTVYRAEDTRLGRKVALKFLPSALQRDAEAKQRFIREAQAASALDHPNICTVYEIDETDDGALFIVMAHYVGESLCEAIKRGPLPIEDSINVAIQIARGLSRAHDHNIVHRDIKPANLFLTEDRTVKILDFGIAKTAGPTLTRSGTRLGTVAYMSPEQAWGETIDHRTDIWSLGVVLHEMLTGERPFDGDYEEAVLYAILHQDPAPVSTLRMGVPTALDAIVQRALAKSADNRYDSIPNMLVDLVAAQEEAVRMQSRRAPASSHQESIVVLPFNDISPGKDNEYFSDGMTEEVIADLSCLHDLRVISRTSAMMLKGSQKDIRTIGRELNVRYVLEGSVRKAGNSLRITAQLIDSTDDSHVWAGKYSGTLENVFEIQEKVSRSIVGALCINLSTTEDRLLSQHPVDDVRAYECYVRARHEVWRWDSDALDRAQKYLQNGLSLIGPNALLFGGLAYVHWQYVNLGLEPEQHLAEAESYVNHLLKLEPTSSHGFRLQGLIYVVKRNMAEGMRHLKRAYELDSNHPDTLSWLAMLYGYIGRPEMGFPLAERLIAIDPLNPFNHGIPGWLYFVRGEFDKALQSYQKMYDMDPENSGHRYLLVQALVYTGYRKEAYDLIDVFVADTPEHPFARMCLFFAHALQGNRGAALACIDKGMEEVADQNYAWFMATGFALIGEVDRALDCLGRAILAGFVNYSFLSSTDPLLEGVRDSPRFQKMMNDLHREWQQFEI